MDGDLKYGVHGRSKSLDKRSRTETSLNSSFGDDPMEKMMVVGKSFPINKSKAMTLGYQVHECHSDTSVNPHSGNAQHKDSFPSEGLHLAVTENPSASSLSFASATSDLSTSGNLQVKLHEIESQMSGKDATISFLRKQLNLDGDKNVEFTSVAVETDALDDDNYQLQLNEFQSKVERNEKIISELSKELEKATKTKESKMEENSNLVHGISLLNKQLQSLLESEHLMTRIDSQEIIIFKNLIAELQNELIKKNVIVDKLQENLQQKDIDLDEKSKLLAEIERNFSEYKSSSASEIVRLNDQISCLEKRAEEQEEIFSNKISQVQNNMKEEIKLVTEKLEGQHKEDTRAAVERCRASFKKLSELSKSRLENLMKLCESGNLDVLMRQKDREDQKMYLEKKINSLQEEKKKETARLIETYEAKISGLTMQIESLNQQLKERKETLDTFENELKLYRKQKVKGRDKEEESFNINELKKLHAAEIFSQQEKHGLEKDLLQKKVKELSDEISAYDNCQKIHLQELQNAKLIASSFKEKYERLLRELEEKINSKKASDHFAVISELELEKSLSHFRSLIYSLKKIEEIQESKIKSLKKLDEDEASIHQSEMSLFKSKLEQVECFQSRLLELDNEIRQLIHAIEEKYAHTVVSLSSCHSNEVKLKDLEMAYMEQRKTDEIRELRQKIKTLEESNAKLESNIHANKIKYEKELCSLKAKTEELAVELLRNEGVLAIKSEIEDTLTERVNELEGFIAAKKDNVQRDVESALSKCMTLEALVSAKEEIAQEYEGRIKEGERILCRSNEQADDLEKHCSKLEQSFKKLEDMTQTIFDMINCENYFILKKKIARLTIEFSEMCAKSKDLEVKYDQLSQTNISLISEKNMVKKHHEMKIERDQIFENYRLIEEEMHKAVERSRHLECELNNIVEEKKMIEAKCNTMLENNCNNETETDFDDETNKIEEQTGITWVASERGKREMVKCVSSEIVSRTERFGDRHIQTMNAGRALRKEKDEMIAKSNFLRENVKILCERVDRLLFELANNKALEEESMPGVEVLYHGMNDLNENENTSTVPSETLNNYLTPYSELSNENFNLIKDSVLKVQLKDVENDRDINWENFGIGNSFREQMIAKLECVQHELCDIINEKDALIEDFENIEEERNRLREEVAKLKKENLSIQKRFNTELKGKSDLVEESLSKDMKIKDMTKEINKLMDYIKTLNFELDLIKNDNEKLVSESQHQLESNHCLKEELKEVWSERYEIEDQLAKLRRENAVLNLHRDQLEQTNKRISNLIPEGAPSVFSWIKIHETVENIVDVVQALKTSFTDLHVDNSKTDQLKLKSDYKNLPASLHLELENKTKLCQELISQKVMLKKELESLESLMKRNENPATLLKIESETGSNGSPNLNNQSNSPYNMMVDENVALIDGEIKILNRDEDQHYLVTLHKLKKHFEVQVHLQETQLTEALSNEIQGLKREMRFLEGGVGSPNYDLNALSERHREEINEINRSHEVELEKLRDILREMKETGNNSLLIQEIESKHGKQMEELRKYFEKKCAELEKNFSDEVLSQKDSTEDLPDEVMDIDKEKDRSQKENVAEKYGLLINEEKDNEKKQILLKYITELVNEHARELKCVRVKHSKEIDTLKEKHLLELNEINDELSRLRKTVEMEKDALIKNYDKRLKEIAIEERKTVAAELEKEFENKVKQEIKNLSELLQAEWKAQQKESANLEESCMEKLSVHETELALKKIITEKELESRISTRNEEKFQKKLEEEKIKIAEHYRDLNEAAFKRFNEEQENLIKSHSEVMHRLIQEHEERISELKRAHKRDLEKFHSDEEIKLAMEFRSREKKFENELSSMKTTYEDELYELKKSCQDTLKEQVSLAKADAYNTLQKQIQDYLNGEDEQGPTSKEVIELGERFAGKYRREIQELKQRHQGEVTRIRTEYEEKIRRRYSTGSLPKKSVEKMEMKTDDDKLQILRERDALQEMVSSLRHVLSELIRYVNSCEDELNNTIVYEFGKNEETLYKSFQIDTSELNETDCSSFLSRKVHFAPDLSGIISEINDSKSLNTSMQVRMELDKCLKQLKSDASHLLALSNPSKKQDENLYELFHEMEEKKNQLSVKVFEVEEMQKELKVDFQKTKSKLADLERNKETVSEGYGEEVVNAHRQETLLKLKEKAKKLMGQHHSQPDILNVLDEICKEGDRLQEEFKREKNDLQQQGSLLLSGTMSKQVDAADKQLRATRKFLEEQAAERESERDEYMNDIKRLNEALRVRERDKSFQDRMNQEVKPASRRRSFRKEALENQLRDVNGRLLEVEQANADLDNRLKEAINKIWTLRDIIRDLEGQVAALSEQKVVLQDKIVRLETANDDRDKVNSNLMIELENIKTQTKEEFAEHVKNLEEELAILRRAADRLSPEAVSQMRMNLREIELALVKKTKDLEQLHMSSANVSCSSPSEDISIFERLDATRCPTPDEMQNCSEVQKLGLPFEEIDRLNEKLVRHTRAEEVAIKTVRDQQLQLKSNRKTLEELQIERDVLLERVDNYLRENSRLKVRLDEQRCNAGIIQRQLSADLEAQIKRLETDIEKLTELSNQKDKQIRDMNIILEQTTKSLKIREAEALNKSNEENEIITNLKTELHNSLDQNKKLEETVNKMRETLRETVTVPLLVDSMLEEKNAEIDRLEKEVARLSKQRAASSLIKTQSTSDSANSSKSLRRVKFSEPDSFVHFISPILPEEQSVMRCGSDSYVNFRISSHKLGRPSNWMTTPESLSSIGPLQLSPRGVDSQLQWNTNAMLMSSPKESRSNDDVDFLRRELSEKVDKINKYECELSQRSNMDEEINEIRIQLKSTLDAVEQDRHIYKKEFEKMLESESRIQSELDSKKREISENLLEIDTLKRKLAELNLQLETEKSKYQKLENDFITNEEEVRKLNSSNESLLMTIETLKRNHLEEIKELENKLNFEHSRVESVLGELNILELKKVEIEEEFLSLKDDYNEKLASQQRTVSNLRNEINELQRKNNELIENNEKLEIQMANTLKEAEKLSKDLMDELSIVKNENSKLKNDYISIKTDLDNLDDRRVNQVETEVQADVETVAEFCQTGALITSELTNFQVNIDKLKLEMKCVIELEISELERKLGGKELDREEALSYAALVRNLISCLLDNLDDHYYQLQACKRKIMECSVDDLTDKVQKELLLSAKLDNKLLSNFEAENLCGSDTKNGNELSALVENGSGDTIQSISKKKQNLVNVTIKLCELETNLQDMEQRNKEFEGQIAILRQEKDEEKKGAERLRVLVRLLEGGLAKEKAKLAEERNRYDEDAKIMEKLRVNFEHFVERADELERLLFSERQHRLALEKLLKSPSENPNSAEISELKCQLETERQKIASLRTSVDKEKKKNQDLKIQLEQEKLERMSEKNVQRLLNKDLALLQEQKDNLEVQLQLTRELVQRRQEEIIVLKRKINLQEIDIKALTISNENQLEKETELSMMAGKMSELEKEINSYRTQLQNVSDKSGNISAPLLMKMKILNNCVQQHVQESNEMGEALFHLTQETEQMRTLIKKIEESTENGATTMLSNSSDDTILADIDAERNSWKAEKERLKSDLEKAKCDYKILEKDSVEIFKNNDTLKLEIKKLKKEIETLKQENAKVDQRQIGIPEERVLHLFTKYMRLESFIKALTFQKLYLTSVLNGYEGSEEEVMAKLSRRGISRRVKRKRSKRKPFKLVALVIIAVKRMQFMVARWKICRLTTFKALMGQCDLSSANKENEFRRHSSSGVQVRPIDPLLYQTHNFLRQQRSQPNVLRTTPNRDPDSMQRP